MRAIFACFGITIGALGGFLAGGFAGWLCVRIIAGPSTLSNPDHPGGMAWFFVFIIAAVGLLPGGFTGFILGNKMFLQWKSESNESTERDP